MALGRRLKRDAELWVPTAELPRSPGHPFYDALNRLLAKASFDAQVERWCEPYYAKVGRPGIAPGVYFRMLFVGYFEGLDSQRAIAWRCCDSLSLREFLGVGPGDRTPDHSTLTLIRQRLPVEVFEKVFTLVLGVAQENALLSGKLVGVDATTLEANAAMKTIVRRATGEDWKAYVKRLAAEEGVEIEDDDDLRRFDKGRKDKKVSNRDWVSPSDPQAEITKMKDGRTHLAHKAEHAVDLETGAVVAVTVQDADEGDTTTSIETLIDAAEKIETVVSDGDGLEEVVGDKGYHSNQALVDLEAVGVRSYISEPDRGRRNWKKHPEARDPVYRNRRRIRAERGKRLLRQRGERLERPFAHLYETGRMRRVHLRGHVNILKRVLLQACALNLGLMMRTLCGVGTPRSLQGCAATLLDALRSLIRLAEVLWTVMAIAGRPSTGLGDRLARRDDRRLHMSARTVFTTGC